jgi:hypothetical protein
MRGLEARGGQKGEWCGAGSVHSLYKLHLVVFSLNVYIYIYIPYPSQTAAPRLLDRSRFHTQARLLHRDSSTAPALHLQRPRFPVFLDVGFSGRWFLEVGFFSRWVLTWVHGHHVQFESCCFLCGMLNEFFLRCDVRRGGTSVFSSDGSNNLFAYLICEKNSFNL